MTFFDLLIIYTAFGAPVTIYSFYRNSRRPGFQAVAAGVAELIFWPFVAIRLLILSSNRPRPHSHNNTRDLAAESIRNHTKDLLRQMAWKAKDDKAFQHIAEAADRYAGLLTSRMASPEGNLLSADSLFALSGHPNEETAVACLMRRNRNRLERHLTYARSDLASSLEMIDSFDKDDDAIRDIGEYLDLLSLTANDPLLEGMVKRFRCRRLDDIDLAVPMQEIDKWELTHPGQKQIP